MEHSKYKQLFENYNLNKEQVNKKDEILTIFFMPKKYYKILFESWFEQNTNNDFLEYKKKEHMLWIRYMAFLILGALGILLAPAIVHINLIKEDSEVLPIIIAGIFVFLLLVSFCAAIYDNLTYKETSKNVYDLMKSEIIRIKENTLLKDLLSVYTRENFDYSVTNNKGLIISYIENLDDINIKDVSFETFLEKKSELDKLFYKKN